MSITSRIVFAAGTALLVLNGPAISQSARPAATTQASPAPSSSITPAAEKGAAPPARKQSAFKDDPTLDPRDKELDRRIRSICRGC